MTISLLWIIGFSPFYVMLDSNSILNWTKFTASVSLFFLFALFNFIWNKKSTYKTEILWNDNETNSFVKIFTYICTCHALSLSSFVFFFIRSLWLYSSYICISNIMFILLLASIKSVIHTLAKNINYYRHHYLFHIRPYKIGTNFIFHKQSNVFVHLHCFWFMARPTDRPLIHYIERFCIDIIHGVVCSKSTFFKTEISERIQNVLHRYYQLYCRKNDAIELKKMILEHKNKWFMDSCVPFIVSCHQKINELLWWFNMKRQFLLRCFTCYLSHFYFQYDRMTHFLSLQN